MFNSTFFSPVSDKIFITTNEKILPLHLSKGLEEEWFTWISNQSFQKILTKWAELMISILLKWITTKKDHNYWINRIHQKIYKEAWYINKI